MFCRFSASLGVALILSSAAFAGAGLDFGGGGAAGGGSDFNFAVSSCTGVGQLTADSLGGGGSGGGQSGSPDRRQFDILSLFQRPSFGGVGGVGGGGGGRSLGGVTRTNPDAASLASGLAGLESILAAMANMSAAQEATNGAAPVNTGYCWCPSVPGGGGGGGVVVGDDDDGGGNGGGMGDDDDGGSGDDDDDGGSSGGGGGPNPSVVPEPGSLALWTLFGTLLLSVTRSRD